MKRGEACEKCHSREESGDNSHRSGRLLPLNKNKLQTASLGLYNETAQGKRGFKNRQKGKTLIGDAGLLRVVCFTFYSHLVKF